MNESKYTRRNLLKHIGGGAAVSGLLHLVPPLESDAIAAGGPPKRLLILWSPLGVERGVNLNWRPGGSEGNLTLHPSTKPFEPIKDRLIWLTGCWLEQGLRESGANSTKSHTAVSANLLTGRPNIRVGQTQGAGPSLDYVVGQKIGADTKFPSLQFTLNTHPNAEIFHGTFSDRAQRITPEANPNSAFDRVFEGRSGMVAGGGAASGTSYADRKKSILDNVNREIGLLKTKVSARDQHRLEKHYDALREIERNLVRVPGDGTLVGTGDGTIAGSCGSLTGIPRLTDAVPGSGAKSGDNEKYQVLPQASDAFNKIIPEVFACDLSRSIMYQWSSWRSHYPWIPGLTAQGHLYSHADMHKYSQMVTWHYQEAMKMFNTMAATKEADGSSVLDNTLCVFVSEFSAGGPSHVPTNMPTLFVGGEKAAPGKRHRLLDFGEMGRSHVDYLQSIGKVFGLPEFGDTRFSKGPIPGLFNV